MSGFYGWGLQPGSAPRAAAGGAGGGFTNNFADLTNFTLEKPTGDITVSSNEVSLTSATDQPSRAWESVHQIPAGWQTITIEIDAKLQNVSGVTRPILALCFDASPTGNPSSIETAGTAMQNGYSVEERSDGNGDVFNRFVSGTPAQLRTTNVYDHPGDTYWRFKVVFTKGASDVSIQMYADGVAQGAAVVDSDASRHTGACFVGFGGRASGGWMSNYKALSVVWT